MRFRKLIAYMKYNAGLTATLPAFVINDVKVRENNEPLVDIKKSDCTLFFGDKLKNEKSVFLRKSVANKINSIAKSLPQGMYLIIYDAYRSWQKQTESWNKKYEYFKNMYPYETPEQIANRTKAVVADPRKGYGGHQTGGAVDVGLCDKNGKPLDMGTLYSGIGEKIRTNAPINKVAANNRKILTEIMQRHGFVNYPNEWWHFCYGDKMWAAYLNKTDCFYGMLDDQFTK